MSLRRSILKDSAMTHTKGYPFAAHATASPMPVFPEDASTTVCPGEIWPCCSAHSWLRVQGLGFRV